jgi:hypothetical protein
VSRVSRVALLLVAALAASAAHARTDGWDAVVDLDRDGSCRGIAAALQPLLEGKTASRFVKVVGSLDGNADAIGVPVLYRSGGAKPGPALEAPVRACVPLIPTTRAGYFRGAPVADGSALGGVTARIHFENVELRVRCGAQTRDFVALWLGAGWLAGYEAGSQEYAGGTISGGVVLSGLLRVRFEGDCDGGRRLGTAPALRPRSFLSERGTARAVAFVNGLLRSDLTKLTLDATGWPAQDADDVCIVHHHTWGLRAQGVRCSDFGAGGLLVYGSADASYRDVYVTASAAAGVYLGEPEHGAAISSFAPASGECVGNDGEGRDGTERCGEFVDASLTSLELTGIVEGNAGGNVLAFGSLDRVRLDFRGENGAGCTTARCDGRGDRPLRGPSLGLFGGRCDGGARAGLAGFVDSVFSGTPRDDCPGGTLRVPASRMPIGVLTVTGEVGGDRGFDGANAAEPDWNGIDVGPGFTSGTVRLAATLGASDVGCAGECDDRRHDGRWLALLGADSEARGTIDLTGYHRAHGRTVIGPYPFVRHDGERWLPWRPGAGLVGPRRGAGGWIAHALLASGSACALELAEGAQPARSPLAAMSAAAAPAGARLVYVGRDLAGGGGRAIRPAPGCADAGRAVGELQLIPDGD